MMLLAEGKEALLQLLAHYLYVDAQLLVWETTNTASWMQVKSRAGAKLN